MGHNKNHRKEGRKCSLRFVVHTFAKKVRYWLPLIACAFLEWISRASDLIAVVDFIGRFFN